jgi:uncharacterized pyridoxamine 5'-phosphate oxidase family protein
MVEEVVTFLGSAPGFHVATVDAEGHPRSRPFNFSMEFAGHLSFCTGGHKSVFEQLNKTPYVEISAFKPDAGEWVRVHGKIHWSDDRAAKEKCFKIAPMLTEIYKNADNPNFKVFWVEGEADFYNFSQPAPLKTIKLA